MQVMVVPISEASLEYAQQVRLQLRKAKLHVDVDATDRKMQKKVREAQLAQYNYILVSTPQSSADNKVACICDVLYVLHPGEYFLSLLLTNCSLRTCCVCLCQCYLKRGWR